MEHCPRCGKDLVTYFANDNWFYCGGCGQTTRKCISVSSLSVVYKIPSSSRQWDNIAFTSNKLRREAEGDK